MDTGRIETGGANPIAEVERETKKIYPRLTLDGKSKAYGELIGEVEVDDEMQFIVTARVCTISSSSTSDWENRIEIEVTDVSPVSSAAASKMKKEFGE
jgi:hypothetical protein